MMSLSLINQSLVVSKMVSLHKIQKSIVLKCFPQSTLSIRRIEWYGIHYGFPESIDLPDIFPSVELYNY